MHSILAAQQVVKSVQLDVAMLTRITGFVIPVLTALITKSSASSTLKALTTTFLSIVGGSLAVVIAAGGNLDIGQFVDSITWTFAIAVASYYGLWKPTGVAPGIQKTLPGGIG